MAVNFKTLRFRLAFSFSAIIIVCILLTSVLGTVYYSRAMSEQDATYTLQLLDQVQSNLDSYVDSTQKHLAILAADKVLLSYMRMSKNADENIRLNLETELRNLLTVRARQLNQINGILITCENGRYLSNEFYRVTKDPLNEEPWYISAKKHPNRQSIISKPIRRNLRNWRKYSSNEVAMLTYAVTDPVDGRIMGTISVDLRLDEIERSLTALRLGQKGTIFVLDEQGEVVYTPTNPLVYRVRPQWFNDGENASFVAQIDSDTLTFLYSTSKYTGWKTIGMFSNNTQPAAVAVLQHVMIAVAVVTLALGVIMSLILTGTVTNPISRLQNLIVKAENGDLNVQYEGGDSYDVDMLGNSFNNMLTKIRNLISLVVEEQKSKRKAEIGALQAQINPHFLYNTLDTIHWMAKEYEAKDIEDMISALTKLFRIGLSHGNEFIPLRDELSHVESYLYIQKIRYEEKLNYTFDVDESLFDLPVLKLIVQPLVENALYHGIKPKPGNGRINVRVYEKDGVLCIDVSDNGVGVTSEKLALLRKSLIDREKGMGFGMFNVNERLELHFGQGYGIGLRDNPYGGIISELRHPILSE